MRPIRFGRALAALLLVALAVPAAAQSGFPWWKDEGVVRELGLTNEQSTRIDTLFRATFPQLQHGKEDLDRLEAELSRLIEINADEGQVVKQSDKVEAARGNLNKARTLMLLHMRQVLTPKQNVKFNAVHEQWRRDNPRQPNADGAGRAPDPKDARKPAR
jgi:Spy/CpxP family protein refolding chaperone